VAAATTAAAAAAAARGVDGGAAVGRWKLFFYYREFPLPALAGRGEESQSRQ
jgi:hypothetical protein